MDVKTMDAFLVLLLVVGACYLTRHLLVAHTGSTPDASSVLPLRRPDAGSTSTRWTALDDHQLNRLLDEFSP